MRVKLNDEALLPSNLFVSRAAAAGASVAFDEAEATTTRTKAANNRIPLPTTKAAD